jgi:hypothetical protein
MASTSGLAKSWRLIWPSSRLRTTAICPGSRVIVVFWSLLWVMLTAPKGDAWPQALNHDDSRTVPVGIVGLPPSKRPSGGRSFRTDWKKGTSASDPSWFKLTKTRQSTHAGKPDDGALNKKANHDHSEP